MCANQRGSRMQAAIERSTVLVEEVVADFDLGGGFEVVWKQHDRYRHLAQVINLRMITSVDEMQLFTHRCVNS